MSSNRFRDRAGRRLAVIGVVSALAAGAVFSAGAALQPNFIRMTPANVPWRDIPGGHGAQEAILFGDPSKEGMYVIRVKFPPHLMDLPHWHPNDRFVTVLEGTWYTGTGETFDAARAVPLKPGSFMMHPAKAAHWDGSRGDETVIVQITGFGPADTTPVGPKQSIWIEVPSK
jgi:quercetin dioxygenase-like cupin family protein